MREYLRLCGWNGIFSRFPSLVQPSEASENGPLVLTRREATSLQRLLLLFTRSHKHQASIDDEPAAAIPTNAVLPCISLCWQAISTLNGKQLSHVLMVGHNARRCTYLARLALAPCQFARLHDCTIAPSSNVKHTLHLYFESPDKHHSPPSSVHYRRTSTTVQGTSTA